MTLDTAAKLNFIRAQIRAALAEVDADQRDKDIDVHLTLQQTNAMRRATVAYGNMLRQRFSQLSDAHKADGDTGALFDAAMTVLRDMELLDQVGVTFNETILRAGHFDPEMAEEAKRVNASYDQDCAVQGKTEGEA